jgi:drug/metabolite transporter (DMT)-like permease
MSTRTAWPTALAMLAFAGNSLLCRMALKLTGIDAASFTAVRLVSGAVALALLLRWRAGVKTGAVANGNWGSAMALFAYAALFSFAYVSMTAATGALLLFGAVQASMIGWGVAHGERLRSWQLLGFATALAGMVALMLPGFAAPDWRDALAMAAAGVAWGAYSLRGKAITPGRLADPLAATCGNFVRTIPMALVLCAAVLPTLKWDSAGFALAVASGAVTSGLGYAVWYRALPALQATHAATVQLSVPLIAAVGGVLLLGESTSWRLQAASVAILGGIALVLRKPRA